VGEDRAELTVEPGDTSTFLSGTVHLPNVDRWWPHTHGAQPLYPVSVELDGQVHSLGKVGFRTVDVDRRHDGFSVVVNGVPVFCRGACWVPPDPVSLASSPEEIGHTLGLLVEGNLNMIRVPGTMTYESSAFLDTCDALGILVWQDCMLANMEPPDDDGYRSELDVELRQVFGRLQGRPCLAVVSGGSEIEQQAAMMGVDADAWTPDLLTKTIPDLVTQQLPGIPYVPSSPTGGSPPFRVDTGVAHYFGVGAYQRPLDDVRRADVRFAAECLAFATPPEPELVEAVYGDAASAGHAPAWKVAVPRDTGASWDFEDVTAFYVGQLFGEDAAALRYGDPERALAMSRAAVVECVTATFSEWRRAGSRCSGGLVLASSDLAPGAGWGVLDSAGHPKAPWYALRRVWAPIALLATDEGLNGIRLHVRNDTGAALDAVVRVELFGDGEVALASSECALEVGARGVETVDTIALFGAFRDLNRAYRFGPPDHDVVVASLLGTDGGVLADLAVLPLGRSRAVERDLGLRGQIWFEDDRWTMEVATRRFAQWVALEVEGFDPEDSWFHLAPGRARRIQLRPRSGPADPTRRPRGSVRALNAGTAARLELVEPPGPAGWQ
jgi:beta-mannosidase